MRPEPIVDPARPDPLRPAGAPAVADRLRALDCQVALVEVGRREVEQAPAFALVVDVMADRAIHQRVEVEAPVRDIVAEAEAEVREDVPEYLLNADGLARLTAQRAIDDRMAPLQREVPGRLGGRQLRPP